jgi:hypothetical protein
LTGLSHAPAEPGIFAFKKIVLTAEWLMRNYLFLRRRSVRSPVFQKIPTHDREQNVMRNNLAPENNGA